MKLILLSGGTPPEVKRIPGEWPEAELADLLGGETEMIPMTRRLNLVVNRQAEALGMPVNYYANRLGHSIAPVVGDAAVVAVQRGGNLADIGPEDLNQVRTMFSAVNS